jgi:hypothetical protein
MSPIAAKVTAIEKRGDQYQVIVQISAKYRGSFNTLPLERSNRTAVPSGMAGLTWSTIKTPALASEIRFRFGPFINGTKEEGGDLCRLSDWQYDRTGV